MDGRKNKIHYRIRSNGGYDERDLDRSVGFTFGKCNSAVFARTEIVGETQGTSLFWSVIGSSGAA